MHLGDPERGQQSRVEPLYCNRLWMWYNVKHLTAQTLIWCIMNATS